MINSAPFSFVRFEHPQDNDYSLDQPYSLPAFGQHDISFQFIVGDDRTTGQGIKLGIADKNGGSVSPFAGPVNATIVMWRYRMAGYLTYDSFELTGINIGGYSKSYGGITVTRAHFEQIMFDDFGLEVIDDYFLRDISASAIITATSLGSAVTFNGTLPILWHQGQVSVSGLALPSTDSFTYALIDSSTGDLLGYSNLFVVITEAEYTSHVTYSCNESGFGFVYGPSNVVRLPMYLLRPAHKKKNVVNRQSNGTTQVLSALVEKEYELATEQMPEVFHECLSIMLSHDNIKIECTNIRENPVNVIESDSYTPLWEVEEERWLLAKARGKVKVSTFGYSNSNC